MLSENFSNLISIQTCQEEMRECGNQYFEFCIKLNICVSLLLFAGVTSVSVTPGLRGECQIVQGHA